ncbi:MAG: AAA family ATPase [Kiritimatiellaeota bacterium]|nr:AAA family ATPase [Kiritimatiellota bacterium]
MNDAIQKIELFIEELVKQSGQNPDAASAKSFFELWENIQHPKPFRVEGDSIELAGETFNLIKGNGTKTTSLVWDEAECLPVLELIGDEWVERILIQVQDDEPVLTYDQPVCNEELGVSFGERLEIVYDIIAYLKEKSLFLDLLKLKRKDFAAALEKVKNGYDKAIVSVMRKISLPAIRKLIDKAVSDMAEDELSDQLSLPLEERNALDTGRQGGADEEKSVPAKRGRKPKKPTIVIPGRTQWSVSQDMSILLRAVQLKIKMEKTFVLSFANASIYETEGVAELTFKLKVDRDVPLAESDILKVFYRGESEQIGTFRIDIFDADTIYGRMRYNEPESIMLPLSRIFALPRQTPVKFIAESLQKMLAAIDAKNLPELTNRILGIDDIPYSLSFPVRAPKEMDSSQKNAWARAVDADNPIVLIQGPPGTGKTKVLTDILIHLCSLGKRVIVAAPSNTAVDNICRKLKNFPVLRFGNNRLSIASDVAAACWIGHEQAVMRFTDMRRETGGGVYAGTHVGLLWNQIIIEDMKKNGPYDAIVFDEAGMAPINEFLLLSMLAKRVVLCGDHKQLPPFPLPHEVKEQLDTELGPFAPGTQTLINGGALEWLADVRKIPVVMLENSYRCQNPRLLRFASILFYDALVAPSSEAEYYQLSYEKRSEKYPPATLTLISTSRLPDDTRSEQLVFDGAKPGIDNEAEAIISVKILYELFKRHHPKEITMIAPYKRQVKLIKEMLTYEKAAAASPKELTEKAWRLFINTRIATVDSFQGGESDAVVISYVRSNSTGNIGFIDDPNRVNVTHTRCRKEMMVIGDFECLKKNEKGNIFKRLERNLKRDGEMVEIDLKTFNAIEKFVLTDEYLENRSKSKTPKARKPVNVAVDEPPPSDIGSEPIQETDVETTVEKPRQDKKLPKAKTVEPKTDIQDRKSVGTLTEPQKARKQASKRKQRSKTPEPATTVPDEKTAARKTTKSKQSATKIKAAKLKSRVAEIKSGALRKRSSKLRKPASASDSSEDLGLRQPDLFT